MKNDSIDKYEMLNNNSSSENFFLSGETDSLIAFPQYSSEPTKRLNDYDSKLLEEDAYKEVTDDLFKLEYKINKIESEIKILDKQLAAAKEIDDYELIEDITNRKINLENEFKSLLAHYSNRSISAKISDTILSLFKLKLKNQFRAKDCESPKLTDKILSKLPKQISALLTLKDSLKTLENLNKSVDELMSMNIPYGEDFNRYTQLSKYIIKANSIQAEIAKNIKK